MRLLLRRAGPDGHRRQDVHGSRLRALRLPELHRERLVRRRRGSHRRLRRHPDVRPVRRRDDPGDLLQVRDEPNVSASHPGSGEEAWSRGSDEVRPGPEPDEVRPGLVPGGYHPEVQPGEVRPGPEPDDHCLRGAVNRVPDEELDARSVPRSTGCFPHVAPWGQAWVPVRPVEVQKAPPEPPEQLRSLPEVPMQEPEPTRLLVPRGEPVPEWAVTAPE